MRVTVYRNRIFHHSLPVYVLLLLVRGLHVLASALLLGDDVAGDAGNYGKS
jgi:hypothetical protein